MTIKRVVARSHILKLSISVLDREGMLAYSQLLFGIFQLLPERFNVTKCLLYRKLTIACQATDIIHSLSKFL